MFPLLTLNKQMSAGWGFIIDYHAHMVKTWPRKFATVEITAKTYVTFELSHFLQSRKCPASSFQTCEYNFKRLLADAATVETQGSAKTFTTISIKAFNPLTTNVSHNKETSQLNCNADQLTGFYLMGKHWSLMG